VREQTLSRVRDVTRLRDDIIAMRRKMRAELDRSDASVARFDLKQGEGGLVDLEFLLQFIVLRDAHERPALLVSRNTPGLLLALCEARSLDSKTCNDLKEAHAVLLDAGLRCTLDRRPRITVLTEEIALARDVIATAARACGIVFDA
jgi:glutamate-ammonia-ligase adenylyltransferase